MTTYNEFMAFELLDDGTKNEIDVTPDKIGSILDPDQVFVIVKEDIRRIYIWKGSKSSVRKRFISSRVAQELQNELIKAAGFHRCIIKSIDQGDELVEFLNTFNLESMEVTEKLPDMRYIRNIERDGKMQAVIIDAERISEKIEDTDYYSPVLGSFDESTMESTLEYPDRESETPKERKSKPLPISPSSMDYLYPSKTYTFTGVQVKNILDEILRTKVPDGFKRQNIIIGNHLFGSVSKLSSVLGEEIEHIEWERIKIVPNGVVDLKNNKIRVYFDEKRATVKGLELLILDKEDKKSVEKREKKEGTATKKATPKEATDEKKEITNENKDKENEPKIIKVSERKLPKIPKADKN